MTSSIMIRMSPQGDCFLEHSKTLLNFSSSITLLISIYDSQFSTDSCSNPKHTQAFSLPRETDLQLVTTHTPFPTRQFEGWFGDGAQSKPNPYPNPKPNPNPSLYFNSKRTRFRAGKLVPERRQLLAGLEPFSCQLGMVRRQIPMDKSICLMTALLLSI